MVRVGPRGAEGGSARDLSLLDAARRFESVDRGGRRETEDVIAFNTGEKNVNRKKYGKNNKKRKKTERHAALAS